MQTVTNDSIDIQGSCLFSATHGLAAKSIALVVLLGISLASTAGCGTGRPTTFGVSGTVTYRGKPLEDALVMFVPEGTRPASGKTDAEGRFTLLSFKPGDGAVVGEHVVCIAKMVPASNDKSESGSPYQINVRSVIPEHYSTPLGSPLRAMVTKDGPNDFHFDLTD